MKKITLSRRDFLATTLAASTFPSIVSANVLGKGGAVAPSAAPIVQADGRRHRRSGRAVTRIDLPRAPRAAR